MPIWGVVKQTKDFAIIYTSDGLKYTPSAHLNELRNQIEKDGSQYFCFKTSHGAIEALIIADAITKLRLSNAGNTLINLGEYVITLKGNCAYNAMTV